MTGIVVTPTATVTMPVEELAKLVKHADGHYFFNLPRTEKQFHRCLRISDRYYGTDPTFIFEYEEDGRRMATVQHSMRDLFETLPLMRQFLAEQRGTSRAVPGELITDVISHLELQNMDVSHVIPVELIQALRSL